MKYRRTSFEEYSREDIVRALVESGMFKAEDVGGNLSKHTILDLLRPGQRGTLIDYLEAK